MPHQSGPRCTRRAFFGASLVVGANGVGACSRGGPSGETATPSTTVSASPTHSRPGWPSDARPPGRPYAEVHRVVLANGREVLFAEGWHEVLALHHIPPWTLADVYLTDERRAVAIHESGAVRDLSAHLRPPLAVSGDGTLVAGRGPEASSSAGDAGPPDTGVVVISAETLAPTHRLARSSGSTPELFLSGDMLLLTHPERVPQVWRLGQPDFEPLPKGISAHGGTIVAATPTAVLVSTAGGLLAATWPTGAVSWSVPLVAVAPPALSPDGASLAIRTPDELVWLATASGSLVARLPLSRAEVASQVRWEDSTSVLVVDVIGTGRRVFRCSSAGQCGVLTEGVRVV